MTKVRRSFASFILCTALLLIGGDVLSQTNRSISEKAVSTIVYHGKVIKPDGKVLKGSFPMTLKIYSPDPELCLLWAEKQTVEFDNGGFAIEIGRSENRIANSAGGAAVDFNQVFVNHTSVIITGATCASGNAYSPDEDDDRLLSATVDVNGAEVAVRYIPIKSAPYAMQANEIRGYGIDNLMKISDSGSTVTYTPSEIQSLKDLLGGDINWDLKNRKMTNVADPVANTDGANKGWVLAQISGLGTGSGTVTTVAGTLPISVSNGSSSPNISISQASASTNGYLSSGDWSAFNNRQLGSAELTGVATVVSTGILQRTGGGSYATLGTTAPLGVTAGNLTISQSNATTNGFLSSADWTSFNGRISTEADPKVGANTTNFLSKWNGSALVTSGVFESGGNVGIGTSSPMTHMHIAGQDQSVTLAVTNASSSAARFPQLQAINYTGAQNGWPAISVNNAQGSSSAPAPLNGNYLGTFSFGGFGTTAFQTGAFITAISQGLFSDASAPTALTFSTANTGSVSPAERLRIAENGNVGIGTSSPATKLHIDATGDSYLKLTNGTTGGTLGGYLGYASGSAALYLVQQANNHLVLGTNNVEQLRITPGGNVGIGTTTPASKVEVAGVIHSSTGGFKFPDGSTQTTASTSSGTGMTVVASAGSLALDSTHAGKVIAQSAAGTITLPAPATVGNGYNVMIKRTFSGGSSLTLQRNAAETIDGKSGKILAAQWDALRVVTDGTNWYIVDQFGDVQDLFEPIGGNINGSTANTISSGSALYTTYKGSVGKTSGNWYFAVRRVSGTSTYAGWIASGETLDGNSGNSAHSIHMRPTASGTTFFYIHSNSTYTNAVMNFGGTATQPNADTHNTDGWFYIGLSISQQRFYVWGGNGTLLSTHDYSASITGETMMPFVSVFDGHSLQFSTVVTKP